MRVEKEKRFIKIVAKMEVNIDRKLVKEAGLSEEEIRKFVENRLNSVSYRLSMWVTETITSMLLLAIASEKPEKKGGSPPEEVVVVVDEGSELRLFPCKTYKKYSRAKKYLMYEGKTIPLRAVKYRIKNPEAVEILRKVMGGAKHAELVVLKANTSAVVLGVKDGTENSP